MAQVTTYDNPNHPIASAYPLGYIAAIGFTLGVLFWGLNAAINYYVVEQVLCRAGTNLTACLNSTTLSGSITTIIIALIGIAIMVRFRIQQPLVVALASAVVLWNIADWTAGLSWLETALWTIGLYIVTYVLFTWIARFRAVVPFLVSTAIAVLIVRVILVL